MILLQNLKNSIRMSVGIILRAYPPLKVRYGGKIRLKVALQL